MSNEEDNLRRAVAAHKQAMNDVANLTYGSPEQSAAVTREGNAKRAVDAADSTRPAAARAANPVGNFY